MSEPRQRPAKPAIDASSALSGTRLQRKCACGQHAPGGGECEECKKKRLLQRKAAGSSDSFVAPPEVHDVLRSPGQPLDPETRDLMESRLGHDFSRVRVHNNAQAAASARAVDALAYTVGSNVVFGDRQYRPANASGQRLLAHELVHVIQQQGRDTGAGSVLTVGPTDDPAERQAEAAAIEGLAAQAAPAVEPVGSRVQRSPATPPKRGLLKSVGNPYRPGAQIFVDEDCRLIEQMYLFSLKNPSFSSLQGGEVHHSYQKRTGPLLGKARTLSQLAEECREKREPSPIPEGPEEEPKVSMSSTARKAAGLAITNPLDELRGSLNLGRLSLNLSVPKLEALLKIPLAKKRHFEIAFETPSGVSYTLTMAIDASRIRFELEGGLDAKDKSGSLGFSIKSKAKACEVQVREKVRLDLQTEGFHLNKAVKDYQEWYPGRPEEGSTTGTGQEKSEESTKTEFDHLKDIAEKVGKVIAIVVKAEKECEKVPRVSGKLEAELNQEMPKPFGSMRESTFLLKFEVHADFPGIRRR